MIFEAPHGCARSQLDKPAISTIVGRCPTDIARRIAENAAHKMLQPVFAGPEGPSFSPGVFSDLRFDRNLLRPSAVGEPIAVHRDHAWEIGGKRYLRVDCEGRVIVRFVS